MARGRRKRIFWTAQDLKLMRKLAGRYSVARIANRLKRTTAAVRFKAHVTGVSLAHRRGV